MNTYLVLQSVKFLANEALLYIADDREDNRNIEGAKRRLKQILDEIAKAETKAV